MARRDVGVLAQWIIDNKLFVQWHQVYLLYQADSRSNAFVFPSVAALFNAVSDSYLCKKLKSHVSKTAEWKASLGAVRDLSRGKAKVRPVCVCCVPVYSCVLVLYGGVLCPGEVPCACCVQWRDGRVLLCPILYDDGFGLGENHVGKD
jgi:hypothetical protein